jgi:phosphopantetheinyl transferase (holo-ACP synthase)
LDHGDCETQANLTDQQPDDKGSIREILARKAVRVNDLSGQICEVSISHDGDFAAAVAMVPRMHKQISKRAVI